MGTRMVEYREESGTVCTYEPCRQCGEVFNSGWHQFDKCRTCRTPCLAFRKCKNCSGLFYTEKRRARPPVLCRGCRAIEKSQRCKCGKIACLVESGAFLIGNPLCRDCTIVEYRQRDIEAAIRKIQTEERIIARKHRERECARLRYEKNRSAAYLQVMKWREKNPGRRKSYDTERKSKLGAKYYINKCATRAKRKGLPFDLDKYEAEIQERLNVGRCELTGIEFGGQDRTFLASIDKIEPAKGYVYENIRIVCFCVNVMMNNWGPELVIEVAERMKELGKYARPKEGSEDTPACGCSSRAGTVSQRRWAEVFFGDN